MELVQFNSGGDLMVARASGKVDIGYVGISPVLAAVEKEVWQFMKMLLNL